MKIKRECPKIIYRQARDYYRFVGYIDLSEADFEDALLQQENHRAETRQGVAVEYLPEKPKP